MSASPARSKQDAGRAVLVQFPPMGTTVTVCGQAPGRLARVFRFAGSLNGTRVVTENGTGSPFSSTGSYRQARTAFSAGSVKTEQVRP